MRGLAYKTVLVAALAGCGFLVTSAAYANDWDNRWDHDHHDRYYHHEHDAPPPPRHVIVERPVIVERAPPVIIAQRPVYVAPVAKAPVYSAPVYSAPAEPSLNLNFNIPLR